MLLGAALLAMTGCKADGGSPFGIVATEDWVKNYVRTQTTPIETKVGQVSLVADDGVKRATAADARVTQALANRYKRTTVETVQLRYRSGQFALLPEHKTTLARVLKSLADNPTFTADIVGYTDAAGTNAANDQLSWRREEVVRRYLVESAPLLNRISFIGLGEDKADGPKNDAADRQVSIVIYRPAD